MATSSASVTDEDYLQLLITAVFYERLNHSEIALRPLPMAVTHGERHNENDTTNLLCNPRGECFDFENSDFAFLIFDIFFPLGWSEHIRLEFELRPRIPAIGVVLRSLISGYF